MTRFDIIQKFIDKYDYKKYLEIGVQGYSWQSVKNECFEKIRCAEKVGVDPAVPSSFYKAPNKGFQITSDDYFLFLNPETKFDIIFIDGLHVEEQVTKDIANSLKHLAPNGTIVMHDCNPPNERFEQPDKCGTVWKSLYKARKLCTDYEIFVVDLDFGCGVIRKGKQVPLPHLDESVLSYNFLNTHRKDILNLKSYEEFLKIY